MNTKSRRSLAEARCRHLCRQIHIELISTSDSRFEELKHYGRIVWQRLIRAKNAGGPVHTTTGAIPHLFMCLARLDKHRHFIPTLAVPGFLQHQGRIGFLHTSEVPKVGFLTELVKDIA